MIDIVLMNPEIPQNTGAIIRLCANCGAHLHLIHPLGFDMDDKKLRRAGLDYHELATVTEHYSYSDYIQNCDPKRLFAMSTHGTVNYSTVSFSGGDALVFGSETKGLGNSFLSQIAHDRILTIPMILGSRSMNLSNSAAVVLYEAWRQMGFN